MALLLCFLLDLRTIAPPLLLRLKESLLQLANLYAVSSRDTRDPIGDAIALCYISESRDDRSHKMTIAYGPKSKRNFSLRDFHHAVINLPMDCFSTKEYDPSEGYYADVTLSGLMSEDVLYSWTGKDSLKKVVFIGSSLIKNTEALRQSISDSRERCVSVEFVLLHQDHHDDFSGKFHKFLNSFSNLGNCRGRSYYPENLILHGLVKNWLHELGMGIRGILQVVLVFEDGICNSTSQIYCNLFSSINQITDGFTPCQTCRCHGQPVINAVSPNSASYCCHVNKNELEAFDMIEHAVKVGEGIILFLSSFDCCPSIQPVTGPINMKVIQRINLASLDEGTIFGMPYVLTPYACNQIGEVPLKHFNSEINCQVFQALCGSLSFLDQGLLCSSTCNTETMKDGGIQCFYILQASYRGSMLLRRIAASEEIQPFPEATPNQIIVPDMIMNSVQEFLSEIPLKFYNPLLHERRLHATLNSVVKESIQFEEHVGVLQSDFPVGMQLTATEAKEAETPRKNKGKDVSCAAEEWEQFLIIDDSKQDTSRKKLAIPPLVTQVKQIDEQTSRILARLEPPKQKQHQASQANANVVPDINARRPLLLSSTTSLNQPLKPSFQRSKRKQT